MAIKLESHRHFFDYNFFGSLGNRNKIGQPLSTHAREPRPPPTGYRLPGYVLPVRLRARVLRPPTQFQLNDTTITNAIKHFYARAATSPNTYIFCIFKTISAGFYKAETQRIWLPGSFWLLFLAKVLSHCYRNWLLAIFMVERWKSEIY